jgi:hypothetical protein
VADVAVTDAETALGGRVRTAAGLVIAPEFRDVTGRAPWSLAIATLRLFAMEAWPAFGRVLIVSPEPCVIVAVGKGIYFSYAARALMSPLLDGWLKSRTPPVAAVTALVAALVAGELDPPEFAATTDTVSVLPTSAATGT